MVTPVTEISGGTFTSSTGPSCTVLAQLGTLTAKGGTFSNTGTGVCMIVRRSATLNIQNSATSVTSQSENGTVHKDEGSTLNILDNPRITNTKYPDRTVMP